ncbi:MAG: hypothetical protein JWM16_3837 [Verrucomicrobiales bacterium]|nr:hypothetical protein [Verrucomicrobiales bacterium]
MLAHAQQLLLFMLAFYAVIILARYGTAMMLKSKTGSKWALEQASPLAALFFCSFAWHCLENIKCCDVKCC